MFEIGCWLIIIIAFFCISIRIKQANDTLEELKKIEKIMNKQYEIQIDSLNNLISINLRIEQLFKGTEETEEIPARTRKLLAKVKYSNPIETYEQYKNKEGLYEPRKPSRGLKIEEREEVE